MPFIDFFKMIQQMTDEDIEDNMLLAEKNIIRKAIHSKQTIDWIKNKYQNDPLYHAKHNENSLKYGNKKYANDAEHRAKKSAYYKLYNARKKLEREQAKILQV
jgi:Skp family chaperone for outer membrane proteins